MSLSQGCTAEYRTVLVWSTTDTRADPAAHTVRTAALQNALPPTNYEHPPYPPAYVDLSRLPVCPSWLSIGLRKKAPGQMCPETDASVKSAHQRSSSRQQGSWIGGRFASSGPALGNIYHLYAAYARSTHSPWLSAI